MVPVLADCDAIQRIAQGEADLALALGEFQFLCVVRQQDQGDGGRFRRARVHRLSDATVRPVEITLTFCRIVDVVASAMEPGRVKMTSTCEPGWIRPATPLTSVTCTLTAR